MNISAFEHDHMYLGPASLKTKTNAADSTSQSLITSSRNVLTQESAGSLNGVSLQQSAHRTQYQQVIQQTGHSSVVMQAYSNQTVVANHHVGNSLNLAGLLREPTPEPEVKAEPVQKEQPIKAEMSEDYIDDEGDIDIKIRNVVCNYTLPLHIDLRKFALNSANVTYDRGRGVLLKQKRDPNCYVKIYSSGKVYIVGCKSEIECRRASRTVARNIQRAMGKLHEIVKIRNYKVCNVLATCKMPFGIKIEELAHKYQPPQATYEPELSVGLIWRMKEPKACLRVHTTGSITVTGACSEADVCTALSIIYPIVQEFRCSERHRAEKKPRKRKAKKAPGPSAKKPASGAIGNKMYFSDEDELYDDDDLEDLDE